MKLTKSTDLFYAAAKAYNETTNRSDYMKLMTTYDHDESLSAWFAIDAYVDLYVPFITGE